MSDPKFTPFKVKRETKLYLPPQFIIMDEAEERQIAVVFDPECVNLIAAAPELYAELKVARERIIYLEQFVMNPDHELNIRISNLLRKI